MILKQIKQIWFYQLMPTSGAYNEAWCFLISVSKQRMESTATILCDLSFENMQLNQQDSNAGLVPMPNGKAHPLLVMVVVFEIGLSFIS